MVSKIIKEIVAGNGNQFSLKEILQEHIRKYESDRVDSKDFRRYVRDRLDTGAIKITRNSTAIMYLKWIIGGLSLVGLYIIFN